MAKVDVKKAVEALSKAKDVPKALAKQASKLLEKINTPEKAAALKGADREAYLKALDEIYGPREARAAEMGLTKKVFHGTKVKDIEQFVPSDRGYYGPGVYVSDSEKVASQYGPNVLPLVTSENLLDARSHMADLSKVSKETLEKAKKAPSQAAANQIIAREGGFAGITAPYKGETVITDTNKIRSINAAFDPRFKDSNLLLASKAGATLGLGALATQSNEAEASMPIKPKTLEEAPNAVRKILSKFNEPRAVLQRTPEGRAEILTPRYGTEPMRVGGDTVEDAALLHTAVMGSPEASKKAQEVLALKETMKEKRALEAGAAADDTQKVEVGAPKQGFVGRTLDKLAIPQRILMQKTAQALGVDVPKQVDGNNSDQADAASEAITERAAANLGIPEDSAAGIAARGTMKTLLDVGYDPSNLIGAGIARRGANVIKRAPGALGEGAKIARESIEALVRQNRLNEAMKLFKQKPATNAAKELAAKGAQQITGAKIFKGKP